MPTDVPQPVSYTHLDVYKRQVLGDVDPARVKFLSAQDVDDEIEAGMALIGELFQAMQADRRTRQPLSRLTLGLKCGGSDGFSGITANPRRGSLADGVCAAGGTALLTEVPEMFGAETLLMNRCRSEAVFQATVSMINRYKEYFMRHGQPIYENPSPGNREGGITTLEDKSLGCVQKGGTGAVTAVLEYAQPCLLYTSVYAMPAELALERAQHVAIVALLFAGGKIFHGLPDFLAALATEHHRRDRGAGQRVMDALGDRHRLGERRVLAGNQLARAKRLHHRDPHAPLLAQPVPVSYTHLNASIQKRAKMRFAQKPHRRVKFVRANARFDARFLQAFQQSEDSRIRPRIYAVSYTHLDVYKRQNAVSCSAMVSSSKSTPTTQAEISATTIARMTVACETVRL